MTKGRRSRRRRLPLWTRLCTVLGAVVMVLAGAGLVVPNLVASKLVGGFTPLPVDPGILGQDIDGAFNFLLVGIDTRSTEISAEAGDADDGHVLSDSMIIAHVPASHDQIYLVSLPRDLYVQGYDGLNSVYYYATRDSTGKGDNSPTGMGKGAQALITAINNDLLGGDLAAMKFAGLAVIDFEGFANVIDQLGGVTMCVDEDGYHSTPGNPGIHSIHYYPDGTPTYLSGSAIADGKFYPETCQQMSGWEALDYSRQRYDLPDGDLGRERHQQQLLKAIMKKVGSMSTVTNLDTVNGLIDAAGDLLAVNLGGHSPADWAYTMLGVGPSNVTMINFNDGQFYTVTPSGNLDTSGYCTAQVRCYQGISPDSADLLRAVRDDTVYGFLATHPNWIASDGDTAVAGTATGSGQ